MKPFFFPDCPPFFRCGIFLFMCFRFSRPGVSQSAAPSAPRSTPPSSPQQPSSGAGCLSKTMRRSAFLSSRTFLDISLSHPGGKVFIRYCTSSYSLTHPPSHFASTDAFPFPYFFPLLIVPFRPVLVSSRCFFDSRHVLRHLSCEFPCMIDLFYWFLFEACWEAPSATLIGFFFVPSAFLPSLPQPRTQPVVQGLGNRAFQFSPSGSGSPAHVLFFYAGPPPYSPDSFFWVLGSREVEAFFCAPSRTFFNQIFFLSVMSRFFFLRSFVH